MSDPPLVALRRLANGYQVSQAIHVMAVLRIADHLTDGARPSDELASATQSDPDALYRLLRALASVGVLQEDDGRRFSLTPLSEGLRSDTPNSLHGWALFVGRPTTGMRGRRSNTAFGRGRTRFATCTAPTSGTTALGIRTSARSSTARCPR